MASSATMAGDRGPAARAGQELGYLRASGLAQARLQVAVLSGNRRRVLEQIDRLVAIDRELARIADGGGAAPCGDLDAERLALASEKLALTSGIDLPRLAPAFGAGMGASILPDEEVQVVEDAAVRGSLRRLFGWAVAFLVVCIGVTAAAIATL